LRLNRAGRAARSVCSQHYDAAQPDLRVFVLNMLLPSELTC